MSTTFPSPREFQERAHEALRQGVRDGHRCQMLMAPTGAGKTYLGLRIIWEALARGKRAVFVADRLTLIEQTSATADRYGLREHGIIQAGHWRRNRAWPFQIASAQTLGKRGFWPEADVIVIDEAHTQLSAWTDFIGRTPAAVIGLSATPFSKGLGTHFSRLVCAATMHELTEAGVLVPMQVYTCRRPDMTGAATSGGEWTAKAAADRGMAIIGDVLTEWLSLGQNRKTICFGSSIDHCNEIVRQFTGAGVLAAAFTSKTTSKEREELLAEFRKPDSALRVLVSVEALAKGFDVADVSCVIDCRPLRKSLSTAIQMWGRGLRSSPETGKKDCILIDHSGNIVRFARDFEKIYFSGLEELDDGQKLDGRVRDELTELEVKHCPECGFQPFRSRCMSCGFEAKRPALIEVHGGTAHEMPILVGGKTAAENARHLWGQLCEYARSHSAPGKQAGRAWHLFRRITGAPPPNSWSFDTTPSAEISSVTLNKITALNIAFARGKAKGAT